MSSVPADEAASLVFITENDIRRVSLSGDSFNKSQQTRVSVPRIFINIFSVQSEIYCLCDCVTMVFDACDER